MAKNDKTSKNSGSLVSTKPNPAAKPVRDSAQPYAANTGGKGGPKGGAKGGGKGK